MAGAKIFLLALAALAASLALVSQEALAVTPKAASNLLRQALTKEKLSPDEVRDLLLKVENKKDTYLGSASVRFLLTYEEISLDRCLKLTTNKESRQRFGVCKLYELDYVPNALDYCRDRLGKQADLCASSHEELLGQQLKSVTAAEQKAVEALTQAVLGSTGGSDLYAYDSLEDRTRLYFWRNPWVSTRELPAMARGCVSVQRFLAPIKPMTKYARYFGFLRLQESEQLNKWMSALAVCSAYNDLYSKYDGVDDTRALISETMFDLYYT